MKCDKQIFPFLKILSTGKVGNVWNYRGKTEKGLGQKFVI